VTNRVKAVVVAALLACVLPLGLTAAPAAKNGRISGKVTDADGKPLAGVKITITTPANTRFKVELATAKDGTYATFLNDATVKYHYAFAAPGFATFETDKKVPVWNPGDTSDAKGFRSEDHSILDVTLKPAADAVPAPK